ncbi:hypothetical protein OX283_005465 [Flavobacterium sp. SUN052]|uniref:hypothetical protein n=1 Tax=Flavobacterium sp. SUN052 TaxID=3002441 RepID=UPI00237DDB58|nr:hypothetical protein [Flavobacterium sp. SUN052]MEC4004094.1 hypothetical protein [Flavobacterium sp. SUN052]
MKLLKNTFNLESQIKKIAVLFMIGLTITSCSPSTSAPVPTSCSTSGTDFQNIYFTTLGSNSLYDDYTTMDLVTHEYTFNMFSTKTICQIGYQGKAALTSATTPYTISIFENSVSTTVPIYTENRSFNSAFTDYYTPTGSPITLVSGHTYTIKRTVNNYLGNISNTTGRICRFNSGPLPTAATLAGSIMGITSSNFYGTGGPVPNYGIPYIDIVFQ